MPMYDLLNGATSYNELASAHDYNGTSYNALGTGYAFNGTTYVLLFGDGDHMVHTSEILSGSTSKAGTPSIVIYDSGDGRTTNLSSAGWRVQGNGRVCAALPYKVLFSGYTKINFTVTANDVFTSGGYLALGYRTDTKTWINGAGVDPPTKVVSTTYGKTGTFTVPITSGHGGGYIIVEEMSQGVGISSQCGVTISKIWLS